MTKDHQAIFSVNPRNPSLSIFIINSRNPSFPSVFSPFFLIRTLSSYYGTSGFPLFSRNPSFLVITGQLPTLLSIPEFPPFLLITGWVPTFLFFFAVNPRKPFFPSLFLGRENWCITGCCEKRSIMFERSIVEKIIPNRSIRNQAFYKKNEDRMHIRGWCAACFLQTV